MSKKIIVLIIFLSILITSFLSSHFEERSWKRLDLAKYSVNVQQTFLERESEAQALLSKVMSDFEIQGRDLFLNENWIADKYHKYYENDIVIFVASNDSALFLSNTNLPIDYNNFQNIVSNRLNFVGNGWYYVQSIDYQGYTIQAYHLIKKEYKYQNRFLVNQFNREFGLPTDQLTIVADSARAINVFNAKGDYVFSIGHVEGQEKYLHKNLDLHLLSIICGAASVLMVILLVFYIALIILRKGYPIFATFFAVASLIIGRIVMFLTGYPSAIHDGTLFSASKYGTSHLLPSLGDLFVNIFLINLIIYFVYLHRQIIFKSSLTGISRIFKWVLSCGLILIIAFYSFIIISFIESLVIDSNLNLNINFIFNIDVYSILGFLIIAGLFYSHYFICKILFFVGYNLNGQKSSPIIAQALAIFALMLTYFLIRDQSLIPALLFFFSIALFVYKPIFETHRLSFSHLIVSFFLFSLIATYALSVYNNQKEISKRKNFAIGLSSEQDPIAEYLFLEIEEELFDDPRLNDLVISNPYDKNQILTFLRTEYFKDFWFRYDIQATTCAPGEELLFRPFEFLMVCDDYFEDLVLQFGRPTLSERFIYIGNDTGRNSYLAKLPIFQYPDTTPKYTLYLEFVSKFIPMELGFPELLIDESVDISRSHEEYSHATYKDGRLVTRFGKFPFSVNSYVYGVTSETFKMFDSDGYSHLLYNKNSETQIIVSRPKGTLLQQIAPFSYLFILFLVMNFFIWRATLLLRGEPFTLSVNFRKRVQISMIAIVLISVLAIGGASAWFIFNIYTNKNEAIINEKAHSILIQLENSLAELNYLDTSYSGYLNEMLVPLSNIFFTDINLYHPQGVLLASSRPRLFDEGIVSNMMNPIARNQLQTHRKSLFIHNERIGNLEYLSAYVPLRNVNKQLIAYINLPYFAQQRELRDEISYFFVAFVNIYLLLSLITIILAFFISNYVSRPLQLIKASLSKVSLGQYNKKIEWSRDDEIGQLIYEYNQMIDELAISAELLSKSERESAWREMAKQVAHEIKNPLTPMRLSVQYLHKALKDRTPDWEDRLDKFAKTMVEQIDTLSFIATQFSDFARIHVSSNEVIDIDEFVPEVIALYKDFENVSIEYKPCNSPDSAMVLIDRKQLLRVFNNLIKNAMQAYEKDQIAKIIISCSSEDRYLKIVIEDFGSGIPDKLKGNLFQPYFTTKTVGMGLGLAMVKKIIDSYNGSIIYESQKGSGAVFIIRIPLIRDVSRQAPGSNKLD